MSRPEPLVSVLLPAYNHERYVVEAVQSVLACDALPLELRVVDDGSTDATVERLRQIDDPRLVLDTQENRGAHVAFGRALDAARGEIVFLINSDDAFLPGRMERLVDELRRGEAVAAATWLELVDDHGAPLGTKHAWRDLPPWPPPTRGPRLSGLGDPRAALLESNWIATTSNFAFRRSAADGLRFRALRYCHDWDFFLAVACRGPVALVEEPLTRYRVHAENTLKESRDQGRAAMCFEILWLLTAHGPPLLQRLQDLAPPDELRARYWAGLPRFGGESLLARLFALRGPGEEPDPVFLKMLDPENALRRSFLESLGAPEPTAEEDEP